MQEGPFGHLLFKAEVRKGQAVKDSTRMGGPVVYTARSSNPSKDYAKVYEELKTRIAQMTPILTQLNELADLTEHYYERGYWRSEKYTQ